MFLTNLEVMDMGEGQLVSSSPPLGMWWDQRLGAQAEHQRPCWNHLRLASFGAGHKLLGGASSPHPSAANYLLQVPLDSL